MVLMAWSKRLYFGLRLVGVKLINYNEKELRPDFRVKLAGAL